MFIGLSRKSKKQSEPIFKWAILFIAALRLLLVIPIKCGACAAADYLLALTQGEAALTVEGTQILRFDDVESCIGDFR
jgi:hypothetical protein